MANKKKQEDTFEHLEGALTRGEQFIEKNQKRLVNALLVVLIIVAAVVGYNKYIKAPAMKDAEGQLFGAQQYFQQDSLALALNGDGNTLGFLEVAEEYGSTPAGNLANYYAGLCYLYLKEYENAIVHLKKFSSDDFLVNNMAKANIGDAYMQLGNYKEAAGYYRQAVESNKNDFTTPIFLMKNALAHELDNDYGSALKAYERLQKDFPNAPETKDVEKYITRAQINLKK